MCGPAELVAAVRTAKQFLTYVNGAPFQPAIAVGLGLDDDVLRARSRRRCRPSATCSATGCAPPASTCSCPQGTYFATVDIRSVGGDDGARRSAARCPSAAGWSRCPSSVFYDDPATGRHLVRFAFCKRTEVLTEAAERLAALRAS